MTQIINLGKFLGVTDDIGFLAIRSGENTFYLSEIAKVTHDVNKAYCEAIGDFSQKEWEDAAPWQRDSAMRGVLAVLDGTATSPEEQHQSWAAQKIAEGWVYGPEKDPEKKTHHCLVPYEQLPPEQKVKDFLFRAVVQSMATLNIGTADVE